MTGQIEIVERTARGPKKIAGRRRSTASPMTYRHRTMDEGAQAHLSHGRGKDPRSLAGVVETTKCLEVMKSLEQISQWATAQPIALQTAFSTIVRA